MKPKQSDFTIEKCLDCLRITRTDNKKDQHTHCHSKKLANTIIRNVCEEKLPYNSSIRVLDSMARLTDNENFKSKINELLSAKRGKSKQDYYNPHKKSF